MDEPSELDANFMTNMLREQTFSEKQTSNEHFSNKTDPLSPAILDQDLSENVDHAGDTKECKEYTNLACSLQSSSNKGPSQIVWGEIVVDRKMFPHQVYLLINTTWEKSQCGGSLINENFVVTAAHCAYHIKPATMKVLVGSLNKNNPNETLWKAVKKFYIHPNYNSTGKTPVADIALIELEEDVKFNSDIRPICLNTKLENRYNSSIYATGWGRTETGNSSDDLKMLEVRIDDEADEYCRLIRQRYPPEKKELREKTTICVAHFAGGGVNKGDSGGPLQVKLQSHCEYTWEQIGITSTGSVNYTNSKLHVQYFVKVEYFIPWIVSVVWPE